VETAFDFSDVFDVDGVLSPTLYFKGKLEVLAVF
jgi:hypothetical protein